MTRKLNFYPGPATLPLAALEKMRDEFVDYQGMGLSLIETSHRSREYEAVHDGAIALLRELLSVPSNYKILLLAGGATLQFGMVPMNFLRKGAVCDIVLTGSWAERAYDDAKKIGTVNVIFDGTSSKFTTLPETLHPTKNAAYVHLTTNETIGGLQWQAFPDTGSVPLVADMSSDILSRPVPVEKFGVIYAGAQKNLGPAGVTVVMIRDDMLARCTDDLPIYLSYKTHAEHNSLYNTPPVIAVYAMKLVLEWAKAQGGVRKLQEANERKAAALYQAIDQSGGFYRCPVDPRYRSRMNVVFRLPSEELEKEFVTRTTEEGMIGLKGHRSVGGIRASIYNAMSLSGAETLASFMKEFAAAHR